MDQQPLVSIIMPTFNRADIISRSIASCIKQTYSNWELLIVDDGSTDPTKETVEAWQTIDSRIRYFQLPSNSGNPSIPRNYAINEARGSFITYLDSDDEYRPEKIELSVAALLDNPNVGFVDTGRERHGFHADPEIWFGCPVDIDSVMHRKSVFEKIPEKFLVGKDGTNWNGDGSWFEEDQNLFGRIVQHVGPALHLNFIGVVIHINHKSRTLNRQVSKI